MTAPHGRRLLHLAAAVDQQSAYDAGSYVALARLAESGGLDFVTLDDSFARPGPDALTVLSRVAPATHRVGLVPTVTTTHTEPFHVQARQLWDAWTPDGVSRPFAHRGQHFDIAGEFTVPRSPQGHPVVIQAGDSDEGREFVAATADVIFTRHGTLKAGRAFYADVKRRLAKYGRGPDDLKIMPGVTVVLGDTAAEAQEKAGEMRKRQISPQNAMLALEQIWGVDLSAYDPDGPLPDLDPVPDAQLTQGRTRRGDTVALAEKWRALSKEKGLSIRQTVIEASGRQSFIGTPEAVAAELDEFVQRDAADGFILVPHLTPGGLDDFVDRVVPLLQERGAFRTEYQGVTLRSHLGLPAQPGMEGLIT
ncbi:LLM class flavin-dependent oxidoreductase [Streptomyces sp. NPDC005202]|uniref:LLM class flavin-dependent oxidoreductase n=1 Tax=Streptomyces sp. NPDC005202 TaxID=3157021 RepID=UPI0033B4AE9B